MVMLVTKYAITALLIVLVSEIAKRLDKIGALIASLPLVTIMVMIWLWVEKAETEKIANHAYYTFWYALPTLPMLLVMPGLLHKGIPFWPSLGVSVLVTILLFIITAIIMKHFGVDLIP
ncbi:MAG: DUF3147 family protein [Opitutales bacterium]|nr:DUF3147 family protein [Opitutales bacterium]